MNDRSTSNQFSITIYPWALWGFALFWLLFTGSMILRSNFSLPRDFGLLLLIIVPAALFWLGPSTQTLMADKITRILTIKTTRPIFGANITEIPVSEIADCLLQKKENHSDSGSRYVYRIIILKKSGEIVPVTQSFTSGHSDKAKAVSRLVAFLGLPGNATLPPQSGPLQVTSGITWRLDRQVISSTTVVRWVCSDFSWPGHNFLFILQQALSINNKLGRMSFGALKKNLLLTLASYGIFSGDQPNFDEFEMLPPQPQLDTDFVCLSNAPDTSMKFLNAAIINTLRDWTKRHPARKLAVGDEMMQMGLIFSPSGTYLCALGKPTPTELDDMIALGVEIVRLAQRAVRP